MVGGGLVMGFFVLIPILVVGGIVWLAVVQSRKNRERREALMASVVARGYSYAPEDPSRTTLFTSAPFGIGDSRKARDVVWGALDGRPFETFAYKYETHQTDSKGNRSTTTHRKQVTWIPLPGVLPTTRLTADNALMRMFAKMGAKDLNVESHEFNQRWKVWCADERVGHAMLTPAVIADLLKPGWAGRSLTIEGRLLMTYAEGHTDLADLEQSVSALYGLVDAFPEFLFTEGGLE